MEDITNKLQQLALKYNITPRETNINKIINIINKYNDIQTSQPTQSSQSTQPSNPIQPTLMPNLINKLEVELCEKESKNIDSILNDIIVCIRDESLNSRSLCVKKLNLILKNNYFSSNIEKKLIALVDLIVNSK